MPQTLPSSQAFVSGRLIYKSSRKKFRSPLTGSVQVNSRAADHFAAELVLPPMRGDEAREWIAARIDGAGQTVIAKWPQPDVTIGSPGSPVVSGAGQIGSNLAISGATPGYVVKRGQFISFLNGVGRYELKMVRADVTLAGGAGTLSIRPAIRYTPASGAAVQIAQPLIEGVLSDDDQEWGWTAEKPYQMTIRLEGVE